MTFEIIEGGTPWPGTELPFASRLDRSGRRQLKSLSTIGTVRKGEVVAKDGQTSEEFIALIMGMVKLIKALPDGREQIVAFRGAGDLLAMHRRDAPWPVTVQAISECTVMRIEWAALERLERRYPEIEKTRLDLASDELACLQQHLLTLGRKTIEEKVATFLLEIYRRLPGQSRAGREFRLPMRRSDIADYLGLTTESVCREITRLKREQIVALPRPSRVIVLDWQALEHLAQGQMPEGVQARREATG